MRFNLKFDKKRIHEIIFEADTPAGKLFDVALLIAILLSVIIIMLETVQEINATYGNYFKTIEWSLTIIFTIEYFLRAYSLKKPLNYIFSFYGLIDLLSILPTYFSFFFTGAESLIIIRSVRLLRVFRILKLTRYLTEANFLAAALAASRRKILVFLFVVVMVTVITGTLMYLIEGKDSGFKSIPTSVYWAIVTLTTVGYGDIAPSTTLGQILASLLMIMGYGIIAVPTGIVTSELNKDKFRPIKNTQSCETCGNPKHLDKARYCHQCGAKML